MLYFTDVNIWSSNIHWETRNSSIIFFLNKSCDSSLSILINIFMECWFMCWECSKFSFFLSLISPFLLTLLLSLLLPPFLPPSFVSFLFLFSLFFFLDVQCLPWPHVFGPSFLCGDLWKAVKPLRMRTQWKKEIFRAPSHKKYGQGKLLIFLFCSGLLRCEQAVAGCFSAQSHPLPQQTSPLETCVPWSWLLSST